VSLQRSSSRRTYDLFISHAWEYSERYHSMVSLLDNAPRFNYRNFGLPDHDPLPAQTDALLTEALWRQIRPVSVVIIIAGMYVAHSTWIQREINIAKGMNKPILGVRHRGGQRTPQGVQDAADLMVNWSTSSIVDGIRQLS
jgi:hypothetical protein